MSLPAPGSGARPAVPATPAGHAIYRELVAGVPTGQIVTRCVAGLVWTLVEAGGHGGLALTLQDGVFDSVLPGHLEGAEASWLAGHITSWNMFDASLALATLNAWYNRREPLEELLGRTLSSERGARLFERLSVQFAGWAAWRWSAIFPTVWPLFEQACELTILERRPRDGDLPDQACEYVLPRQDCVCITGIGLHQQDLAAPARAVPFTPTSRSSAPACRSRRCGSTTASTCWPAPSCWTRRTRSGACSRAGGARCSATAWP